MAFSERDWRLLEQIIFDIHSASDQNSVRMILLDNLKELIPYEKATFYLSRDYKSAHFDHDPVAIGFNDTEITEYHQKYENIDLNNWMFSTVHNDVYILSELYSAEELENDIFFQQALKKKDIEYAVYMPLSYEKNILGIVSLYRSKKNPDFSIHDKECLRILKRHLTIFLKKAYFDQQDTNFSKQNLIILSKMHELTPRETEIFMLLAEGKEIAFISEKLFISDNTMRKHLSNIYKKMGVKKRSQLNEFIFLKDYY